jgi:biopolymer transport protein ExbD
MLGNTMFFEENSNDDDNKPLTEINMIPLIDVMLVLLVLFIITVPLLVPSHLRVEIPQVASTHQSSISAPIELAINKKGELFWHGTHINDAKLMTRLTAIKQQQVSPAVQLQADKTISYQRVVEILSIVQNAGITQIAFVTEPLDH